MRHFLIIAGILLYIVIYLVIFLVPLTKKIKETKRAVMSATADLVKVQRETKRLEEIKQLTSILETQVQELEKKITKKRDEPYIIRTITRVAETNGVELTNFSIGRETISGTWYDKLLIDISCLSDYHSLARFITDICQQDKVFSVEKVDISQVTGRKKTTINCNLVLVFFIFK